MEEIWKNIYYYDFINDEWIDYRGLYQVSSEGNVKSLGNGNNANAKERILKPVKNNDGYLQVILYKNKKKKHFLIHRLVAHMFLKNDDPYHKIDVNHKDENPSNNSVSNLELCTREYNINFGIRNKRVRKSNRKAQGRKVIGYSLTETKVIILQSTKQAEKFGFDHSHICKCCNGKQKSHKGFKWYYLDDIKNNKLEED